MSSCCLSRDVPRCVASCRAVLGTEEARRVPLRSAACARCSSVPYAHVRSPSRSTLRAESSASVRGEGRVRHRARSSRTRRPQEAHRFQTPSSSPAPTVRSFQASISASTSGRHARRERGAAPAGPFHRARSAARRSPRATTSSGIPSCDQRPRSSRSRAPSARPRPRTTAKSTSTCSAKVEVGGRRLIPHLWLSRRPAEGWARLTSHREVEDDAAATPKKFPTRSTACPLARRPGMAPEHKGPESLSTCDAPSSFS